MRNHSKLVVETVAKAMWEARAERDHLDRPRNQPSYYKYAVPWNSVSEMERIKWREDAIRVIDTYENASALVAANEIQEGL